MTARSAGPGVVRLAEIGGVGGGRAASLHTVWARDGRALSPEKPAWSKHSDPGQPSAGGLLCRLVQVDACQSMGGAYMVE